MRNFKFSISILLLSAVALAGCSTDRNKSQNSGAMNFINMVSPGGKKLLPVENGPVRNISEDPLADLDTFTLKINGLVDSPYTLTWDQIMAMKKIDTDTILMYCVEGWEVWGRWKGVSVSELLSEAGVMPEGKYVLFRSPGDYTTSLPVSYLEKYNAILAYEVNGDTLSYDNGFPLRLVAFGKFGYKWAKCVNVLEVTDTSRIGFWEEHGYSDSANVPIKRRRFYEGADAMPLRY